MPSVPKFQEIMKELGLSVQQIPGVSGLAVYVPSLRVQLEDWCAWTGADWGKVSAVVGHSFRIPAPNESIYTITASAVLRLILQYDIDPAEVGMLALGTESSTDNSAGAVIVRGMVDAALTELGKNRLSSSCEVPELKHACLGGIYALKAACRYVASDGMGRKAIVVSGDIAEYARGSSGEQTQGAGAVAMLVEAEPKLFAVDLTHAGSASNYRGPDFRKPTRRFVMPGYEGHVLRDYPVFNGKYSTFCYVDAVLRAARAMFSRLDDRPDAFFENVAACLFHRPYHWMPIQAMAVLQTWTLTRTDRAALEALCDEAGVDVETVLAEASAPPSLFLGMDADAARQDPCPALSKVARILRKKPEFTDFVERKMGLGSERMMRLGNLYTAALPAWLAAAFTHALEMDGLEPGQRLLAMGYGSGDAAEAIPLYVAKEWREAASRIDFDAALAHPIDLDQPQYEALHDGAEVSGLSKHGAPFVIDRIGDANHHAFQDIGMEYYGFAGVTGS